MIEALGVSLCPLTMRLSPPPKLYTVQDSVMLTPTHLDHGKDAHTLAHHLALLSWFKPYD